MRITRAEDLPDWFHLGNYKDCRSFKAVDWLINLQSRKFILELLSTQDMDGVKKFVETHRESPIEDFYWPTPNPTPSVRPLTYADIVSRAGFDILFSPINPTKAEQWANLVHSITSSKFFPNNELRTPIGSDSDHSYPLEVDLRASDSILIEAFVAWLRDVRSQNSVASTRERPAYKDWARYGLLPYLDLLIWSEETGHSIPHRLMAEAVGYRKGGDSFRKTVPPLAERLMADLSNLESLAAIEGHPEEQES